jgi:hypothetical protein
MPCGAGLTWRRDGLLGLAEREANALSAPPEHAFFGCGRVPLRGPQSPAITVQRWPVCLSRALTVNQSGTA